MRALLFTIGSRGEVQPLLALALALRAEGHTARLCAPPNFQSLAESFGVEFVPIGPDVQKMSQGPRPAIKPPVAQRRSMGGMMVRMQFDVLPEAARDCDAIVGAGALSIAARSIAESIGARYRFVAFCPVTFPMPEYPPLNTPEWREPRSYKSPTQRRHHQRLLWSQDQRSFNDVFRDALNDGRAALKLPPVSEVRRHMFGQDPLLAADPKLAPGPNVQTGAWFLRTNATLPDELERFLAAGEPPVYFGFGSMVGRTGAPLLEAARALKLRAIVSRGWANLDATPGEDWIAIDDVDHEALFPRVAAIVHHGGAGTTHAAARAGKPQLIVPHMFDQFYYAHRVQQLGIGAVGLEQLRACLQPPVRERASSLAAHLMADGAQKAARELSRPGTYGSRFRG